MAVGVGCAAVAEQMHDLMDRLLMGGEVVPKHRCISQVGLRVAFLGVDEEWEVGRVSEEEDGCVVVSA